MNDYSSLLLIHSFTDLSPQPCKSVLSYKERGYSNGSRKKGPSSKIPFQAKSRARTRTHLTFMSCVPTCPSHRCLDPQAHESSSGLLETHTGGLCVVTNSQEKKDIDSLILDFEFYMGNVFGDSRQYQEWPCNLSQADSCA